MNPNVLSVGSHGVIKCNICNLRTNHELKAIHAKHEEEEYDLNNPFAQPSWWIDYEYRFWVCLGCDTAVLQIISTPMDEPNFTEIEFYPSRKSEHLNVVNFVGLDPKLKAIYSEVIQSYNAGLNIICGIGLRALLEGICVNKGITDKDTYSLKSKLQRLKNSNLLPANSNIVQSLDAFKFIGDDAAHKLEATSQEELKLAIEVMEDLLKFMYEAEYNLVSKAQRLVNKRLAK